MATIQSIPNGLTGQALIDAVNNSLRQIQGLLPSTGPETSNLDMGGNRIINLANGVNPQDAVNVRQLKAQISATKAAPAVAGSSTTVTNTVVSSSGYFDLSIIANAVGPDLKNATSFRLTLNQAARVTVQNPMWTGGALVAGLAITIYVVQDATGSRPTPSWDTAFGSDVKALQLAPDAGTQSVYILRLHPKGSDLIWRVDGFVTAQLL